MSQVEEMSLDDVYTEPAEVEVVTEEVEAVEAEEPEAVETEPEIEPEGETTAPKKDEWTLTAVMDEREKRQAAVKENESLREQLAALEPKPESVSVFEDEAGFKEQQDQKIHFEVENAKLSMAKAYAVRELGQEAVDARPAFMKALDDL